MDVTLILSVSSLVMCSIMAICAVTFIIHEFIYLRSRLTIFNGCCVSIFISKAIHLYCEYQIPLVTNTKMEEVYWKLGCFLMNSTCHSPYLTFLYFRTTCVFVLAKPWERQLIKYFVIFTIFSYNIGSFAVFLPLNLEQYQIVYGISSLIASILVFVNDIFYMLRFRLLLKMFKNVQAQNSTIDGKVWTEQTIDFKPKIVSQYGLVMTLLQLGCLLNYIFRLVFKQRLFDIPIDLCLVSAYITMFAMKLKLDHLHSK
ncbi:hypothetical protein BC833DRAFT_591251, partial [Globomyces pollinis-pini]